MVEIEEIEQLHSSAPVRNGGASKGSTARVSQAPTLTNESALDTSLESKPEELSWKVVCIMYAVGSAVCFLLAIMQVQSS